MRESKSNIVKIICVIVIVLLVLSIGSNNLAITHYYSTKHDFYEELLDKIDNNITKDLSDLVVDEDVLKWANNEETGNDIIALSWKGRLYCKDGQLVSSVDPTEDVGTESNNVLTRYIKKLYPVVVPYGFDDADTTTLISIVLEANGGKPTFEVMVLYR